MKRWIFAVLFAVLAAGAHAQVTSENMLSDVTVTGAGASKQPRCVTRTFQVSGVTSSGAGAATVLIQASNVPNPSSTDWLTLGTITLTLSTTRAPDGFVSAANWRYVRANVTALSGTGATVRAWMGC